MAPQELPLPGTRPTATLAEGVTVDTNILRKNHPESSAPTDEMVETHYASLERAACPFCYEGWVFLGYEGVDDNGELVEVDTERVPCRRCRPEAR